MDTHLYFGVPGSEDKGESIEKPDHRDRQQLSDLEEDVNMQMQEARRVPVCYASRKDPHCIAF